MLVHAGAADYGDVNREGLVPQILLAAERHDLDELARGQGVALAALEPRVDEGAEAGLRDDAGAARADLAVELAERALRQQVGLYLARVHLGLEQRGQVVVAGDDALEKAGVGHVVHAPVLAVAYARRVRHRESAGMPALEEAVLDALEQILGAGGAHEAGYADRGAVLYGGDSPFNVHNFEQSFHPFFSFFPKTSSGSSV